VVDDQGGTRVITSAFEYARPGSVDEAQSLLNKFGADAKVIAGGQSLIPLMRLRLSQPTALVDIQGIPGLNEVRRDNGTVLVGALVRHVDIQRNATLRETLPLLAAMANDVGDNQIRNLGTIGGVIAHGDAAGDYNAVVLMLDAEIVTNKRTHQARDFYRDIFTTALEPDEVITAVRFPVSSGRFSYTKFRRRLYDWAIAGVAVQEVGSSLRVGYVNLARTPLRGAHVEQALAGGASADDAAAVCQTDIDPTSDVRATAEYKRHLTQVLTARTLQKVTMAA
jgi:carbon-monoxide dehydrogenase medium subunit